MDYSIDFHTLAEECKWNEEAQWNQFLHGLADRIQKEIFTLDLSTSLYGLIELAIHVDTHLQCCDQHTCQFSFPLADSSHVTVSPALNLEPMQVGRT